MTRCADNCILFPFTPELPEQDQHDREMIIIMKLSLLLSLCLVSMALSAPSPGKVAVIGATGRLGREAVQQLHDRGIECNILVRKSLPSSEEPSTVTKPDSTTSLTKSQVVAHLSSLKGVHIVEGDVTDVESLHTLLDGCTACLALFGSTRRSRLGDLWNPSIGDTDPTHAKAVNYRGVANLIQAAKVSKTCKRIVRITGKGETPTSFFSILINLLGSMAKAWNYEGERLLRDQQDVEYTIIRPGIMSEKGPESSYSLTLADDGGDLPVSKISYADIATLSIECLAYPNAARSTLVAMTKATTEGASTTTPTTAAAAAESYAPLLQMVQPDRRNFPTNMLEQHYAAVRNTVCGLGVAMLVLLSAVVRMIL